MPSVSRLQLPNWMSLRPSEPWGLAGISCFHLGSHWVGMPVCVSRSSQPKRWLPVGAITNAGTTDACAQISIVEPTWLSELIDKESGWPQLWRLLQTEQDSWSGPELSRGDRV